MRDENSVERTKKYGNSRYKHLNNSISSQKAVESAFKVKKPFVPRKRPNPLWTGLNYVNKYRSIEKIWKKLESKDLKLKKYRPVQKGTLKIKRRNDGKKI